MNKKIESKVEEEEKEPLWVLIFFYGWVGLWVLAFAQAIIRGLGN